MLICPPEFQWAFNVREHLPRSPAADDGHSAIVLQYPPQDALVDIHRFDMVDVEFDGLALDKTGLDRGFKDEVQF